MTEPTYKYFPQQTSATAMKTWLQDQLRRGKVVVRVQRVEGSSQSTWVFQIGPSMVRPVGKEQCVIFEPFGAEAKLEKKLTGKQLDYWIHVPEGHLVVYSQEEETIVGKPDGFFETLVRWIEKWPKVWFCLLIVVLAMWLR